jgi:hypothetical protein
VKLKSGEFETEADGNNFVIMIMQEGDFSFDGGNTFESQLNIFDLDRENARHLRDELNEFIGGEG